MPSSNTGPKATVARGLFGGLAEGVRRLLAREENLSAPSNPAQRAVRTGQTQARLQTVPVGCFSLVGLADIRNSIGPRWDALAEKVHTVAEATIARHLLKGDVFEKYDDTSYVLLFAQLGRAEAEFKCRAIRNEIARQLLGTEWAGLSRVGSACAELQLVGLAPGTLDDTLAEAFGPRGGIRISDCPMDERPLAEPEVNMSPTSFAGEDQPQSNLPSGQMWTQFAVDEKYEATSPGQAPLTSDEETVWLYEPVWDFSQMTLLRFRLVGASPVGLITHPCLSENQGVSERERFRDDVQALTKVSMDLADLAQHGRRLPVTCPINHMSLGAASQRAHLLRLLASVPSPMRKFLTLELAYPQDGLWSYGAKAFYDLANPLGVGWAACFPLDDLTAIRGPLGPIKTVTASASAQICSNSEKLRQLSVFAARARASNLECGIYELSSRAAVVAASSAGFRFLSGDDIHAPVPDLKDAIRFEPADLYGDLLR